MRFTALQLLVILLTIAVIVAAGFLFLVLEPGQYARTAPAMKPGAAAPTPGSGVSPADTLQIDTQYIPIEKIISRSTDSSETASDGAMADPPVTATVNLNTAGLEELTRLPRVGPATAQRIIEYREQNGPFHSIQELTNISGIGPKTVERFRSMAYCGPGSPPPKQPVEPDTGTTVSPDSRDPASPRQADTPSLSRPVDLQCGSGKININTARSEELQTLPRIGPSTAEKIIDYRTANGPFTSVDDLTKVKGIGAKTLDRFRDKICVE